MSTRKERRRLYLDADLPSNDSFVFDGTNSDVAQQLYYRSLDGDVLKKLTLTQVPDLVQDRLADLQLEWEDLDGIAQRALLWDSGFAISSTNAPIQIFPLGDFSMTDLAVQLSEINEVGCLAWYCTQPDDSLFYTIQMCPTDQMLTVTRCIIEDFFEGGPNVQTTRWSTGGDLKTIPQPRVYRHAFYNDLVLSIHMAPSLFDEPEYGECPHYGQNDGGYGSVTIPCSPAAPGDKLIHVKGSDWVSRWLVEKFTSTTTPITTTAPAVDNTRISSAPAEDNTRISTTAPSVERTKTENTLGTPATIGIIVVCAALVVILLGFIIARRRHSEENQGQTGLWDDDIVTANRIPREKVRIVQLVSRGAFGEVYAGVFNGQRVAVKMLLPSTRRDIRLVNEFLAEAKLTASMEHPRIVTCIGIAWNSLSDLCVVLEFMEGGDLRTMLNDFEKANHPTGFDREKVTIALHVCHALTYLHSLEPPVIHRDLKSRNILLNEMLEAKLTDFGISRERLDRTMTAGVGTSLWMAPEVMMGEKYDVKADMFSFGVVLSELDLHTLPYTQAKEEMQNSHGRQMRDAALLQKIAMGTVSVEFSDAGLKSMVDLGYACVAVDPTMRPSAAEALFKLQVILSKEL